MYLNAGFQQVNMTISKDTPFHFETKQIGDIAYHVLHSASLIFGLILSGVKPTKHQVETKIEITVFVNNQTYHSIWYVEEYSKPHAVPSWRKVSNWNAAADNVRGYAETANLIHDLIKLSMKCPNCVSLFGPEGMGPVDIQKGIDSIKIEVVYSKPNEHSVNTEEFVFSKTNTNPNFLIFPEALYHRELVDNTAQTFTDQQNAAIRNDFNNFLSSKNADIKPVPDAIVNTAVSTNTNERPSYNFNLMPNGLLERNYLVDILQKPIQTVFQSIKDKRFDPESTNAMYFMDWVNNEAYKNTNTTGFCFFYPYGHGKLTDQEVFDLVVRHGSFMLRYEVDIRNKQEKFVSLMKLGANWRQTTPTCREMEMVDLTAMKTSQLYQGVGEFAEFMQRLPSLPIEKQLASVRDHFWSVPKNFFQTQHH